MHDFQAWFVCHIETRLARCYVGVTGAWYVVVWRVSVLRVCSSVHIIGLAPSGVRSSTQFVGLSARDKCSG